MAFFDASASWLRHTRFLAWVTITYFVIRPILKIIWKTSVLTMKTVAFKTTTITHTHTHIHFSIFWFLSRKLLFRCILTEHKHALSLIQFTRFQLSYYKISDKVSFITRTLQQHTKHTHTHDSQSSHSIRREIAHWPIPSFLFALLFLKEHFYPQLILNH